MLDYVFERLFFLHNSSKENIDIHKEDKLSVHHKFHGNHKEKLFKRATLHNLNQQMGREGGGGHLSTDKSESFYNQVKAVPYMDTFEICSDRVFVHVLSQHP